MANIRKPLAAALGAAFLASSVAPLASAASNPFSTQLLSGGYDLANYDKAEGKCGDKKAEGSCGDKKAEGSCGDKKAEGSCGDKKAEGSCGDKSAQEVRDSGEETKVGEGSCGEGKYGTEGD